MNNNKKMLAVLSVPAIASLLAVAVTTPVKAANRDFYDESTTPYTVFQNSTLADNPDQLNKLIDASIDHPAKLVYEFSGKYYNYDSLYNSYVAAKTANPSATTSQVFTSALAVATQAQDPHIDTTKLAVSSVSATNLKTVTVNFNKAVDPSTITSSTVKVYNSTSPITDSTSAATVDQNATASNVGNSSVGYILSSDNKTLSIVFGDNVRISQSNNIKVAIDGVATVGGAEKISGYAYNQVVTDTTAPAVTGVTVNNAKAFTVSLSEPLGVPISVPTVLSNIKVDGVAVVGTVTPDYANSKLKINLPTALSVGNHNVTVTGLTDYIGLKTPDATFPITVASDTTPPSIASAKIVDKGTIDVTFNEDLDPNALGSYTVNGYALSSQPQLVAGTTNQVELKLDSNHPLDLGAIVETDIAYQGQADAVGNTVASSQTFKFNAADDTTLPTVAAQISTDSTSKNTVTLTFSKSMASVGAITVSDSNGNVKANLDVSNLPFKTNTNNTVLVLNSTQLGIPSVNAGTYTLDIKNMKDNTLRQNALPETKLSVNAIDTKAPSVENNHYSVTNGTDASSDKVTFFFDEPMDATTLNNLSNYIFSGNNTPLSAYSTTINNTVYTASVSSVAADGKSVTLIVPNASNFQSQSFGLYSLKDLAGNPLVAPIVTKAQAGDTIFNVTSATAIDNKTVKVVLSTPVASLDPSSFKLAANNISHQPTSTTAFNFASAKVDASDSTGKTVLLTVSGTLSGNADYTLEDISSNQQLTKNIYGVQLQPTSILLTDAIAPTIKDASIEVNAGSSNYRAVTMSADGLTGTIDLSDLTGTVKNGKIAASENANLSLILPTVSNASQQLTASDLTYDLSQFLGASDVNGDGVTLSTLQNLAKADGDGNDSTLTLTGKLTDSATTPNSSLVKLVIKVK